MEMIDQSSPQHSSMMTDSPLPQKSNTMFVIFGAIFLLGVGAIGGYLFSGSSQPDSQSTNQTLESPSTRETTSPAPDETVQWKSIVNEQVGLAFKYPDNFVPYADDPQVPNATHFEFSAYNSEEKRGNRLLMEDDVQLEVVVYKPAKTTLESYLFAIEANDGAVINTPFPGITGSYTKVKTLTNGNTQTAIIYSEPEQEYSEYDAILVEDNNVAIIRIMTGSHTKRQELLPILDQLVSSFSFVD